MRYAAVIVYYNPEIEVLDRLKVYQTLFDEIIIIDNSEEPNFDIKLKVSTYERVLYISMEKNMGMSVALNEAFTWAIKNDYDFLLTLDQDSEYNEISIKIMMEYINNYYCKDVGIYVANIRKKYVEKNGNIRYGKYCLKTDKIKCVKMALTSGSFVNIKAIKCVLPLKNYFIAYVDQFLSFDLMNAGYKIIRVGKSCMDQQVGNDVTYGFLTDKLKIVHHKEIRYYYMFRNNRYLKEHCLLYNDRKMAKWTDVLLIRLLFNIIIAEPQKIKKINACIQGYKDYKNGKIGIINDESLKKII